MHNFQDKELKAQHGKIEKLEERYVKAGRSPVEGWKSDGNMNNKYILVLVS